MACIVTERCSGCYIYVTSWSQTGRQSVVGLRPPGHLPGAAPEAIGGHPALPYNTNLERLPRPVSLALARILSDPWQSRIKGQEGHRGRLPNSVEARRPGNIEAEVLIAATRSARESRLDGVSSSKSNCKPISLDAMPLYNTLRHWSAPGKQTGSPSLASQCEPNSARRDIKGAAVP